METASYKGLRMSILGDAEQLASVTESATWNYHFKQLGKPNGLIFVVDSTSDAQQMMAARDELNRILELSAGGKAISAILVVANKTVRNQITDCQITNLGLHLPPRTSLEVCSTWPLPMDLSCIS